MPKITLTKKQLSKLKLDMDKKAEMLSDEEIHAIAQKVNNAINLPFLSEKKEFVVFIKVIRLIDKSLYKFLPNEYYELVKDSSNGITKAEADKISNRITPLINNIINIPVLTENMEGKLISIILDLIINAMVKGFKLEEAPITQ